MGFGFLLGQLLKSALVSDDEDLGIIGLLIPFIVFFLDGLSFFLFIFLPVFLLLSLPAILFGGSPSQEAAMRKAEVLELYQTVPIDIRKELDDWIIFIKQENADSDIIEVNDGFNIDPHLLMCIDAVHYNQDFKRITYQTIYDNCSFMYTKTYDTTTIQIEESYYEELLNEDGTPKVDKNGVKQFETKTRMVDRQKTTINITMRDLGLVCQDLYVDAQQVLYMYNNVAAFTEATFFKELTPEERAIRQANAPTVNVTRQQIIDTGFQLVGKVHYFWGGKSPAGWNNEWGICKLVTAPGSRTTGTMREFGLDCSGYVDWVYKTAGVGNLLSDGGTAFQWNQSYPIKEYELQPGDLVFMNSPSSPGINHVGIFVNRLNGKKYFLHCSSSDDAVVYNSWQGFKFYRRPYVKFQGD